MWVRVDRRGAMEREIVVILDRLKGCRCAEETQMMDRD